MVPPLPLPGAIRRTRRCSRRPRRRPARSAALCYATDTTRRGFRHRAHRTAPQGLLDDAGRLSFVPVARMAAVAAPPADALRGFSLPVVSSPPAEEGVSPKGSHHGVVCVAPLRGFPD
eukprot:349688-Chlamydomonas_euryale.AAC.6